MARGIAGDGTDWKAIAVGLGMANSGKGVITSALMASAIEYQCMAGISPTLLKMASEKGLEGSVKNGNKSIERKTYAVWFGIRGRFLVPERKLSEPDLLNFDGLSFGEPTSDSANVFMDFTKRGI